MHAGAHGQRRSALLLWAMAALAGWGMVRLWDIGQGNANSAACLAAALLAVVTIRSWWSGMVAHDDKQIWKGLQRASKKKSKLLGDSDWATREQIRAAGMEKPSGIFLAEFEGREIFYTGENSMTVLAPPGAGKTTCFASQLLLRTDHDLVIVNDPKLEQWLVCAGELERRGYRVLVISAWYESFAVQFGGRVKTHDDGFDPGSFLDPNDPCIIDDCRLLASLLIPASKKGNETSDFFNDFSRSILTAFMLLILSESGKVTLPKLRARIMAPEDDVMQDIAAMLGSDAFSGVLAEEGARLYSPKVNAPKEWSGGLSGAMRALKPYDAHGPLGRSVEKAGVDFRTVGDQKTVVFFAQPPEKIESHEGYASMTLVLAMEMIARDRRKKRCAFLLDELQNNPSALLPVLKGIALYRGSGIQFICLFQFLAALKRHIGDSWREFLSVDVFVTFGVPSDPETCDIISRLTGQTTVRGTSFSSDAERLSAGGLGVAMNSSETARPLLTASETRTLGKDEALIFTSNLRPIRAKKQSYLNNTKLRRRAARNPYYE